MRVRYPQPGKKILKKILLVFILLLICIVVYSLFVSNDSVKINEPQEVEAVAELKVDNSELALLEQLYEERGKPLPDEIAYPRGPISSDVKIDKLVVNKKERLMEAFSKNKVVRVYSIALGQNPVGHKQEAGDFKTPEGTYSVDKKGPDSFYYKSLSISYPNAKDRKDAKNSGKTLSNEIKIHGISPEDAFVGSAHKISDWTNGSIALTNEEMDELYNSIVLGSPIIIKP